MHGVTKQRMLMFITAKAKAHRFFYTSQTFAVTSPLKL
jgi:hypothetical protein